MSIITVDPGQWVEVFDENTSGSFRIVSMLAKVKRAAITPTEGGVTINVTEKEPSELLTNNADGSLKLYVFNSGSTQGYVEKDI